MAATITIVLFASSRGHRGRLRRPKKRRFMKRRRKPGRRSAGFTRAHHPPRHRTGHRTGRRPGRRTARAARRAPARSSSTPAPPPSPPVPSFLPAAQAQHQRMRTKTDYCQHHRKQQREHSGIHMPRGSANLSSVRLKHTHLEEAGDILTDCVHHAIILVHKTELFHQPCPVIATPRPATSSIHHSGA